MPATAKVRELWPIYSTNLKLHLPRTLGSFLCPICLRYFEANVLEQEGECDVSEGHIIPQAMGGKEVTLECRDCNNTLGTTVDSSLAAEHSWHRFEHDGGERKATIVTAEGRRPVSVQQEGSEIIIRELHKSRLPGARTAESIRHLLDKPFDLIFDAKYSPEKIPLAAFHSAFLMMFRLIGYEYAVSAGGRAVGCWLLNRFLPTGAAQACQTLKNDDVQPLKSELVAVATFNSTKCFAVPIPGVGKKTRRIVFLPAFERSDLQAFIRLFDGNSKSMPVRFQQVGEHPPITALADREFKEFGHQILESAARDDLRQVTIK